MFLIYLAPLIMLIDIAQLLVAERYIGVKQIRSGVHPLDGAKPPPTWAIVLWLSGIAIMWLYMLLLLLNQQAQLQAVLMFLISLGGFGMRRVAGVKWALVLMTIETAIRLGLLANLLMVIFFFGGRLLPASFYH